MDALPGGRVGDGGERTRQEGRKVAQRHPRPHDSSGMCPRPRPSGRLLAHASHRPLTADLAGTPAGAHCTHGFPAPCGSLTHTWRATMGTLTAEREPSAAATVRQAGLPSFGEYRRPCQPASVGYSSPGGLVPGRPQHTVAGWRSAHLAAPRTASGCGATARPGCRPRIECPGRLLHAYAARTRVYTGRPSSEPVREAAMATGETGFDDVTFDLISVQYHSLKAGHDYGQYVRDAMRAGRRSRRSSSR